ADLHIYVTASLKTRVERIAERDGTDYKEARKETIARTRSEVRRFKRMYNVDIENTDIYDIILSTDRLPRELCVSILIASCKEFVNNKS
ncbi:MAG: cytidylate kinase family protein, partial [Candidatus Heimdallarchaeota archaeon]|nr:cytidylate kinase family protein [Candidatus Heimdallarchaeota archaeon]